MGLRSWVAGLFETAETTEDDDDSGEVGLELVVDVDRRAGAIMEHYGLSGEDARAVAEILDEELSREEGYARTMIVDRVARELEMDESRTKTIVDTEVASVRNLARVRKFERQTDGQARFRWVDSVGRDDSPVCAAVRDAIDERGPVSRSELETVIREAASDHESGTPARADDLVPHESCRHTVVRHVETT
jgi:hypothetical protein